MTSESVVVELSALVLPKGAGGYQNVLERQTARCLFFSSLYGGVGFVGGVVAMVGKDGLLSSSTRTKSSVNMGSKWVPA